MSSSAKALGFVWSKPLCSSSFSSPLTLSSPHVQELSHCSLEYVVGRPIPHHWEGRHSDWLLLEAAGLTSSSIGELTTATFLLYDCLTPLFSHLSVGDRPKPMEVADRQKLQRSALISVSHSEPRRKLANFRGGRRKLANFHRLTSVN
jgi:hypothetical protein